MIWKCAFCSTWNNKKNYVCQHCALDNSLLTLQHYMDNNITTNEILFDDCKCLVIDEDKEIKLC